MIKNASVIYRAGYGGMFWRLCLALSPETVPLVPKDATLHDIDFTPRERFALYSMSQADDWMRLHQGRLQDPAMYKDPVLCDRFCWTLFTNHPSDGGALLSRLPWLHKMFLLVLDHDRHQTWLDANRAYWGAGYPSGKVFSDEMPIEEILLKDRRVMPIDMSCVISSESGFIMEYLRACEWLEISSQPQLARDLWAQWRAVRVIPFLAE